MPAKHDHKKILPLGEDLPATMRSGILQGSNAAVDAPALRTAFFLGVVVIADFAGGERDFDFQHLRFFARGDHIVTIDGAYQEPKQARPKVKF